MVSLTIYLKLDGHDRLPVLVVWLDLQGYSLSKEVRVKHELMRFGQALCLRFSIVKANSKKSLFIRYLTPTMTSIRIGWLGVSSMRYDFQGYLRLNEVRSNHGVTRFGHGLCISLSIVRWH